MYGVLCERKVSDLRSALLVDDSERWMTTLQGNERGLCFGQQHIISASRCCVNGNVALVDRRERQKRRQMNAKALRELLLQPKLGASTSTSTSMHTIINTCLQII